MNLFVCCLSFRLRGVAQKDEGEKKNMHSKIESLEEEKSRLKDVSSH